MKSIVVGVLVLMGLVIAAFAVQPENAELGKKNAEQPTKEVGESEKAQEEEKLVYFQMTTSMGELYLELNNELAPISTSNFQAYTEAGHYNGTIFHRVIENFMIQGGAFKPDMSKMPSFDAIENEWTNGLSNTRGTLAMARLGGRANSATAQFFINVTDNAFLDQPRDGAGYAVFGRVVKGMDVVDKIRVVATGNKGSMGDVPVEPIVIEKVVELDAEKVEELGLVDADG
jgi:peptidyl-prolyl cis-trans isomerase A (cyclophilin A)